METISMCTFSSKDRWKVSSLPFTLNCDKKIKKKDLNRVEIWNAEKKINFEKYIYISYKVKKEKMYYVTKLNFKKIVKKYLCCNLFICLLLTVYVQNICRKY